MGEFRQGWRVVLAAGLGSGLGISGLLTYNSGLFVEGLGKDIGLSRTAYGAAFFGATVSLAAAMPVVGRLVDRFGARAVAAGGAAALALGFLLLSAVHSIAAYFAAMVALGLFAAPSAPVPFTRAVVAGFERSRGLALGLTQVGIGLAAALVPPLVGTEIARHGWRNGFVVLAGLAALGLLPALFGLPGRPTIAAGRDREDGAGFAALRRSRPFLIQLAAFTAMALAFAGMLTHFVPMLREGGLQIERAAALAGLIGMSVIVTRIVVGWLADRIEPAWLGAASCVVCALGCVALALGGTALAPAGALALGAAMGAEADLIGILTARNFPIAAYSRAYALQYAAFTVAAGISPLWIGYLADRAGGYQAPLLCVGAGLLVPAMLFAAVPRGCRSSNGSRQKNSC
ncbi:MAG: MFS transporter [Novosphingobium sp.]|nr:MFS transporter [Novosphingobium sp.]